SLASAASCTINLTFTPPAVGTVTGTLSITDNASGNPQTVSLSGTGTKASVFIGLCVSGGGHQGCQFAKDLVNCPAGQPAQPTGSRSCGNSVFRVDGSAGCTVPNHGQGVCIVN